MSKAQRKLVVVIVVTMLVGAALLGRNLITGAANTSPSGVPATSRGGADGLGTTTHDAAAPGRQASPASGSTGGGAVPTSSPRVPSASAVAAPNSSGALPPVPVFPIAPQVVRTATIDVRIGTGKLGTTLTDIAALAATDGGYVESSSMTGGTARSSPVSGSIVIHVPDADFAGAMTQLAAYGKVTNQQIQGKDVTDEVAANAATLQVLQEEVNLLQGKLAQTTDINTFLQIQDQLFPVEQQLQQLQNQQAVLENSAALATITADLAAPGAPLAPEPPAAAKANAATVAWRYLRHNSLAVLDGLAVGGGWALPVVLLLGGVWLGGTRYLRRRRRVVNPA